MLSRRFKISAICLALLTGLLPAASAGPRKADAVAKKERAAEAKAVWGDLYPAFPGDIVVSQPDGSKFKATLTNGEIGGNLEYHGYTVTKRADGWWVYATGRNRKGLLGSGSRVGIDTAPAGLKPGLGRVENIWTRTSGSDIRTQAFEQLRGAALEAMRQAQQEGEPTVFKFPVLMLATWWDADAGQTSPQFQEGNTAEHFKAILDGFGGNPNGTLTEFYFENSFGQFLVQVDVHGPYTSQRSMEDRCYYGGIDPPPDAFDDLDPIDSALGVGGGGALGMAAEAVPQADPEVDFTEYDNDGDGDVDFTGLLHSGPDMAATGDPCHTWSHAIDGSFGTPGGIPTADGVTVGRVFTMPEIGLEIGVATHEMAHALGEPDYYNPSYTSAGTGDWDIMAGGSWFGNPPGSNPVGFQPASKVFQGWMTPRIVHNTERKVKLEPRELLPAEGYTADQVNPNVVLVPTEWVQVGQEDRYGYTWTEDDVYGLVQDGDRGYVVEGYYLENINRMVNGEPIHPDMTRAPYFDRQALSSGLMVWHFDYYYRSNVINGSNNAGSNPNRPQMDPLEFDFNDNTQELQLNLTRGEPSDLVWGAATGITSGTRQLPPGTPTDTGGEPQAPIEYSGVLPPTQTADHPFVVEDNPANYRMTVSVTGLGDCTLELLQVVDGEETSLASVDGGFVGATETIQVTEPEPGDYIARVGDFAACSEYSGDVTFESAGTAWITTGAADTWSNWAEEPTGWAFTNVGPKKFHELDHSADAPTNGTITLDIVKLGNNDADVSPGFVRGKMNKSGGFGITNVRRPNRLSVPVFNNGGKTVNDVEVEIRRGSRKGKVVARGTISKLEGYSRTALTFNYKAKSEGWNELYAIVDPDGRISEEHEGNNVQKADLWVGPRRPKVMIVDDDGSTDSEQLYAGALASLDIPYAIVTGHVKAKQMRKYQAVIWEAGLERYQGQLDETDRAEIKAYLDDGGNFLYTSPRAAAALGAPPGSTNPGATDEMPAFLADYFGVAYADTVQVGGGKITGAGDIFGNSEFQIDVFPGRPLQDVFTLAEPTEEAPGIGERVAVAAWNKGGEGSLLATRVNGDDEHKNFKTVFLGYNLQQLLKTSDVVSTVDDVMKHFGVKSGGYKAPKKPLIYHASVRNRISGDATPIRAIVLGRKFKGPVKLYYRVHGTSGWESVTMKRSGNGAYLATIPGSFVTPNGVEYYIKAGKSQDPVPAPKVVHAIGVGLPEQ